MHGHTVHASPTEGEHGHIRVVNFKSPGAKFLVKVGTGSRRDYFVGTECHYIATQQHGVLIADRDDLDILLLKPLHNFWIGCVEANRGQLFGKHAYHQIDVYVVFGDVD